jgi:hypothetical protein
MVRGDVKTKTAESSRILPPREKDSLQVIFPTAPRQRPSLEPTQYSLQFMNCRAKPTFKLSTHITMPF